MGIDRNFWFLQKLESVLWSMCLCSNFRKQKKNEKLEEEQDKHTAQILLYKYVQ